MENSKSCFRGNPGISLGNISLNSSRTGKYYMHCSLSYSMSQMFTTNNLQPFLMHFFACRADICLTETFFGIPWTFTWFPRLSIHKIDLCTQSSMIWFYFSQSMPISTSYNPKGTMLMFDFIEKPFSFTSQYLTIFETLCFVLVANFTSQGLSCFTFPSFHTSIILGDT